MPAPIICTGRLRAIALLGVLIALPAFSAELAAQSVVSGVVVDSISGAPIAGAVVFGADPGIRAVTDSVGRFRLNGIETPTALFVSAFGYARHTLEGVITESVTIQLVRAPVVLEGIEATVTRFQTRLDSIHTLLDRSAKGARWGASRRGVPRIALREDIQRYDDANDPEIALAALWLFPAFDFECGWRDQGRDVRPGAVYVDGETHPILGCQRYLDMDVSSICRMEWIPPGTLYVWSCAFLARLADGQESVPNMLQLVTPAWWNIGN